MFDWDSGAPLASLGKLLIEGCRFGPLKMVRGGRYDGNLYVEVLNLKGEIKDTIYFGRLPTDGEED